MYGIYVAMYIRVCITLAKLIVIFGVIFLAFVLIFYLLHLDEPGFTQTGDIIIKVFVMMTGEFEFSKWLVENSSKKTNNFPKVPFNLASYVSFFLFVFLVAVAFTNLLVSTATSSLSILHT